jgi:hypothetical protein
LALLAWVVNPALPELRVVARSPYQVVVREGDRWSIL